jgi:two-component system, OmpR family, response regulator MprA
VPQILVIDGNAAIRDVLRRMLERQGYGVHEATTGVEGLHAYGTVPTDVVITDVQTPDMDGLQMLHTLRRTCPAAKIIAMSGSPGPLRQAKALTAHTFAKPFALQPLLTTVQALVEEA